MNDDEGVTRDTLLRGRVTLFQPRRGYRSSLDPVLLAGFLASPFGHFVDFGCGTGALSFLLLARDSAATGVGVEIQPRLAALVARGIEANGVQARFRLALGDLKTAPLAARSFDLVATNPPFQPLGQGELPPDEERAVAHHELRVTLEQWLDRAVALCKPTGRIAVVFPAARADELTSALPARGFVAARTRLVIPRENTPPRRILLEARRVETGARPEVLPPLILHEGMGYSAEVRELLGEAPDAGAMTTTDG